MKKALRILLCAVMLAALLAPSFSALVVVNNNPTATDKTVLVEAPTPMAYQSTSNGGAVFGFMNSITPVDISSKAADGYISAWVYISDPTSLESNVYVELCSGGAPDKGEFAGMILIPNAVAGWNHVIWKMSDMEQQDGGVTPDWAAINYVRVFAIVKGGTTMTLAAAKVTACPNEASANADVPAKLFPVKTIYDNTNAAAHELAGINGEVLSETVNVSAYKVPGVSIGAWVYFGDTLPTTGNSQLELNSCGGFDDANEYSWGVPVSDKYVANDWNLIIFDFAHGGLAGTVDLNAINNFRFFLDGGATQSCLGGIYVGVAEEIAAMKPTSIYAPTTIVANNLNEIKNDGPAHTMGVYSFKDTPMDLSRYLNGGCVSVWVWFEALPEHGAGDGQLEFCSGGTSDSEECGWVVDGSYTLQAGWNQLIVPIGAGTGADWTRINYIRFYQRTENANNMVVANITVGYEADLKGKFPEGLLAPVQLTDHELVKFQTNDLGILSKTFEAKDLKFYNLPNVAALVYIYVEGDGTSLTGGGEFEITSSGQCDVEETGWNNPAITSGWNRLVYKIGEAKSNLAVWSEIDFIRFFYGNGADGSKIHLGPVYLGLVDDLPTVSAPGGPATANAVFNVTNDATKLGQNEYLYLIRSNSGINGDGRFNDDNAESVYGFHTLPGQTHAEFKITLSAQYAVYASTDCENWTLIDQYEFVEGQAVSDGSPKKDFAYNLDSYLNPDGGMIYIKIGDSIKPGGWGGFIFANTPVSLSTYATVPATQVIDPLPAANEGEANVFGVNLETPIDLSALQNPGMALCVYLYIEDPTTITQGEIEITSSGEPDKEETHWGIPEQTLVPGMNKLILRLPANGAANLSAINFIRAYFLSSESQTGYFGGVEIGSVDTLATQTVELPAPETDPPVTDPPATDAPDTDAPVNPPSSDLGVVVSAGALAIAALAIAVVSKKKRV